MKALAILPIAMLSCLLVLDHRAQAEGGGLILRSVDSRIDAGHGTYDSAGRQAYGAKCTKDGDCDDRNPCTVDSCD